MLLNVAIPGDRNVIKKEAEKILKYKDLTIEIQRMWNVKKKGDWSDWTHFEIIKKIREYDVRELQKTATAHIVRKVLMKKYIRVNAGTSDMGTINSSDRIAATLYFLGKLFVSGIWV
jgi:hypothetical protein